MDRKPLKAVFNWSGGKDSALALQKVLQEKEYEVVALLTTVNGKNKKSTMHDIPLPLLKRQAESIGIPLHIVELSPKGNMENYADAMKKAVDYFGGMGVKHFIFGDIFLHDVKSYREKQLTPYGVEVVEPLWGKSSEEVMDDFLESGLRTVIVTTMADILDSSYIGRTLDRNFVRDLPESADVCGENGEYHTFCYDGDIFKYPVPYSLGEPVHMTYPIKMEDGTEKDFSSWFANLRE